MLLLNARVAVYVDLCCHSTNVSMHNVAGPGFLSAGVQPFGQRAALVSVFLPCPECVRRRCMRLHADSVLQCVR